MNHATDILDLVSAMKARGEPFALATVVRTVSMTAAKAGAKAVILPDGRISEGWIGGGCRRRRRSRHRPTGPPAAPPRRRGSGWRRR